MAAAVKYLRHCPTICLGWLRKSTKKLSHDSWSQDCNQTWDFPNTKNCHALDHNVQPLFFSKPIQSQVLWHKYLSKLKPGGKNMYQRNFSACEMSGPEALSYWHKGEWSRPVLLTSAVNGWVHGEDERTFFPVHTAGCFLPCYLAHRSETNEPNHLWTDWACHYALWMMVFVARLRGMVSFLPHH
jgi:hypothetical protein